MIPAPTIVNQILAILPEKFRKNKIIGRSITEIKPPSQDISARPLNRLDQVTSSQCFNNGLRWNGRSSLTRFYGLLCPRGTRRAYLENEDTKALLEVLMLLDQLCIEEKIVQPRGGQYLMHPRAVRQISGQGTLA